MTEEKPLERVRCWEEDVMIPTYPVQDPDPNPMFLEKRVYQGSSGKVYPNPFTDRVSLEKEPRAYRAIMLENEYIQLMILPEIGGRIHAGMDKTNDYPFFYRQHVIKPALVGLLGPWISGGVEFNWPQHHRPSTYMPVHAATEQHSDGTCTVWLSEHDPMLRMKGMVGISLAPGRSMIEAKVRLYNRTPLPQTFLWWANVAVRVHDQYQAFFPPDVTFVADHAKRAITSFPVARGSYYGIDYRPGTDISWYKNIRVPTSYMVTDSKYDFFGGYDHAKQAGLVHTSDHHIAPGKKLWTWGNAEFGYAWDRNLTDEDGPYVELMAGAYTDNQPDFSWIQPYEAKRFSQFWYPIQKIGPAKNANREAAVNLEFEQGKARLGVAVTERRSVRVVLTVRGMPIVDEVHEAAPNMPIVMEAPVEEGRPEDFALRIEDEEGHEILSYRPEPRVERDLPNPASEPLEPRDIESVEELYLTGLHLEQYRHATRSAEAYWAEGLAREPDNARLNNAMGLACLRRGELAKAEEYFERAVQRLTMRNPNPNDGEVFYNLGLAQQYQGKSAQAYEAFYKAVWNYAWKSAGCFALAGIATAREELREALEMIERSLEENPQHLKARALKTSLLREMNRRNEAQKEIEETLALDPLDFRTMAERLLLSGSQKDLKAFVDALEGDVQTLLDVTYDLAWSGLRRDAFRLLRSCTEVAGIQYPMVWYTLAWLAGSIDHAGAADLVDQAERCATRYCFPARLEEMIVLEDAIERKPAAAKAHYYLGNLYYDKRRYQDAMRCWRRSIELDDSFSIPLRNLAIAEFNINEDAAAANGLYKRSFRANPADARLLYEWDQLKKRAGLASAEERLAFLSRNLVLAGQRDDLVVERVTLLNQFGRHEEALGEIGRRRFSPCEGGEGLVSGQYVAAHRALGVRALSDGRFEEALRHFEAARLYPENLGEGKHLLTLERDLDYFSGLAAEGLGDGERARGYWRAGAAELASFGRHSYFQACALQALGEDVAAKQVLLGLADHANAMRAIKPKIDYFATSLPNMLLFEDDLEKRNRTEATFLLALATHGLGDREKALELLGNVLVENSNHLLAIQMLAWLRRSDLVPRGANESRQEP